MEICHKFGVKFTANTDRSMSLAVLSANFEKATYIRGETQKKPVTFSGGRVRCNTCFRC